MKKITYKYGEKVGELIFIKDAEPHVSPSRKFRVGLFQCKCGNEFSAIIRSAVTGNTKSCGCYGAESRSKRFTKHGKRHHPLYGVWCSIKSRCYNENRSDYKYYGGRGIALSDEFKNDFIMWFEYVTSLPGYAYRTEKNLTIDRIDNDKNYERGNIRWATKTEQANNRAKKS